MDSRIVLGILLLSVGVLGLVSGSSMSGIFQRPEAGPISLEEAVELAKRYVTSLGNPDLSVKEVMEFELNFYFIVYEKSTGIGAFEMLIDRYSGWIRPEPGPNMMWNKKYGMMRGMGMRDVERYPTANMPITTEQAEKIAEEFLRGYLPGASVEEPDVFYGYYTFHVQKEGRIHGMFSINGYSGQVWHHNWHGAFIAMKELH